ncbi:hypothetical protein P5673_030972 [Acropora cervicornis]|uniref:Uncharacterized protein n=1 Tax=Acropora cervicornis TaxID=6130 RepID=A0AAD9PTR0_ACRCE|nr:hypothetical protein P5673_030972 [Acropora cervicornis]
MRTAINSQVPSPPDENDVELDSRRAVEALKRKKNWSAPGPDRAVRKRSPQTQETSSLGRVQSPGNLVKMVLKTKI